MDNSQMENGKLKIKNEVLIDGVDVSGCDSYSYNHNELMPYGDVKITEHYCYHVNRECNGKDCDYKQLQRLQAKYDDLHLTYAGCKTANTGLQELNEKLQAENERLKVENERIKRDFLKQNQWLQDQKKEIDELKTENEQLKAENKKLKYYLNKIREDELNSMDVEWDEYITECTSTEYTNVITFVELALGERDE